MESLPVRRKSCLLRIRENCPFRKLRRKTYDVSAATSSPIGSYWNTTGPPSSKQPIRTVYSDSLPSLSRCQSVCSPNQSELVADVHMEEEPDSQQNQQNQQNRAEDCMDLDNDVDPETGERAQG